jgi:hypothetical protein
MGTQGAIVTSQPFVNRRPWNTLVDVEYSYQEKGTSDALQTSQTGTAVNGPPQYTFGRGDDIGQDYQIYLDFENDCSEAQQTPFPHTGQWAGWAYEMFHVNGYHTSGEGAFGNNPLGLQLLINFIEFQCATLVQNPIYLQRFIIPVPLVSDGQTWIQEPDTIPINPYYDISRHDYT